MREFETFYINSIDNEIVSFDQLSLEAESSYAAHRPGEWRKLKDDDLVRVQYWQQETVESGGWRLTGLMTVASARKLINSSLVERGRLVADSSETA